MFDKMAALPTEHSWDVLNLQEVTALWWFTEHSDGNLNAVVLQRHQSKGGMTNFTTNAAAVTKGRVTTCPPCLIISSIYQNV
jgi:hypothetical protein